MTLPCELRPRLHVTVSRTQLLTAFHLADYDDSHDAYLEPTKAHPLSPGGDYIRHLGTRISLWKSLVADLRLEFGIGSFWLVPYRCIITSNYYPEAFSWVHMTLYFPLVCFVNKIFLPSQVGFLSSCLSVFRLSTPLTEAD
jgi:hypothetical protein